MDLRTTYLGLPLKNPLVLGASPLSSDLGRLRALEDSGIAAVVTHSIFEEQIRHEQVEVGHYMEHGADSFAEALSYFPNDRDMKVGPDEYLHEIEAAKRALGIPVIGSVNGTTTGGWIDFARLIQEAGADALELNIYFLATDPNTTGAEIEDRVIEVLREVRGTVTIPVAVKLSPYFSSMANMARRLDEAGADGLVLFNRFYQPDIDLERLAVEPRLILSKSDELRLPLRWIAILHGAVKADLALTSGVHTEYDVLKAMLAGAKVTQMTSALLKNGANAVRPILDGIRVWMEEHEYASICQMQGSLSQKSCPHPAEFERANYLKALQSWK
ncbi:dihydroorotate dehydrogenase-like protein [Candidatus Poribacteria bacterium]|nr:dihydroorotate dehydrogenase-like protein [Candidatus Poribacteria bacterium]